MPPLPRATAAGVHQPHLSPGLTFETPLVSDRAVLSPLIPCRAGCRCRRCRRVRTVSRSTSGRRQSPSASDCLSWCGSTVEDLPVVQQRCPARMERTWLVAAWLWCRSSTDWEHWDFWRTRRSRASRNIECQAITDCSTRLPCLSGFVQTSRHLGEIRTT
jgi:hypothetical protein